MTLESVVAIMVTVIGIVLVATCALCLNRTALRATAIELKPRLREAAPYLGVTALFLAVKRATHELSLQISHELAWDITTEIYAVEGQFVAALQNVVPEVTLGFFSAMYVFGFSYVLVTAPILYFALPSQRYNKELLVAYLLNYAVGVVLYTLFIAYGPRNHLAAVEGLMYQTYPQTQTVSAAVSDDTNVFPSLHTSLAVTALLFAWRSRREYPRWFLIASFVVPSIVVSTMYLGIHWLVDVVAGILLAVWSVYTAERLVAHTERRTRILVTSEKDV